MPDPTPTRWSTINMLLLLGLSVSLALVVGKVWRLEAHAADLEMRMEVQEAAARFLMLPPDARKNVLRENRERVERERAAEKQK